VSSPFTAVNHIGFVVRSLDEALAFFADVLGFEPIVERRGDLLPIGDVLNRRFGIDPTSTGRFAFMKLGASVIELLEWSAPDQNQNPPLNSDVGGRHLAITVSNMNEAIARLNEVEGVTVREPNDAGYVYCQTPLGLEIQLIPA
jgi:catechol 2,3-dioxygenase-like lactoylglutathione lyase family enzyme